MRAQDLHQAEAVLDGVAAEIVRARESGLAAAQEIVEQRGSITPAK